MEDIVKPIGEIVIKDFETGEIVYQTHNMIVEEGRKLIYEKVFSINDFSDFYPYFETIGNQINTSPSSISITDIYDKILVVVPELDNSNNELNKKFSFKLTSAMVTTSSTNPIITQIGLIVTNNGLNGLTPDDENNPRVYTIDSNPTELANNAIKLFSRAPIDEFYLRVGRTYEVDYTIKF